MFQFQFHTLPFFSESKQPPHILVNLSNMHRNIMFTSKTVCFLHGVAYDFYSIDELNNRSRPGLQWKTFPLLMNRFQLILLHKRLVISKETKLHLFIF
jgi:hypothetical protein